MEPRKAQIDTLRMRALAHPLRIQLLGALRIDGEATASRLAERLGTSSGMTSYHLRQLADAGLIEEVEARGTARERWWRPAHDVTHFRQSELPEEAAEGAYWLQREQERLREREWSTWTAERNSYGDAWRDAAGQADFFFRLTPQELDSLLGAVYEVLNEELARTIDRRDGGEPTPPDAEGVRLHLLAFPVREVAGYRLDDR